MNWQIRYYNQALQQEIMKLPEGLQARYIHLTKRMMEFGPSLGMPHSRAMGEGLFELRLTTKEGQARVFYCTMVNNQIIMLHTFIKKTPKTPNHERELAKRRMREVKAQ